MSAHSFPSFEMTTGLLSYAENVRCEKSQIKPMEHKFAYHAGIASSASLAPWQYLPCLHLVSCEGSHSVRRVPISRPVS